MIDSSHVPPRTSRGNLQKSIERIRLAFLKKLSSEGTPPFVTPGEAQKLLTSFYKSKPSPSGPNAEIRRKIVVVKTGDPDFPALQNDDLVEVTYGTSNLNARVKRVSEYPNAPDEFGTPSVTILLEWEGTPIFIDTIVKLTKGAQTATILDQASQADNFIISPRPPNSEPDPPIMAVSPGPGLLNIPVAKSDFRPETYLLIENFPTPDTDAIKVVVSDTGLKFNLDKPTEQHYQTCDGQTTHFPIAGNPGGSSDPNRLGFCSLTTYMDDAYAVPPAAPAASFPGGIPAADGQIWRNPHDDHEARHGTHVAAIVAQNTAGASAIIPLKIFDFLGFGTLFDILCGFNYIFSRLDTDKNIKIVNASWGASVPNGHFDIYALLEKKIKILHDKNVFVIAAAGNRDSIDDTIGHDLTAEPLVPACYSEQYPNVITVTSVAETWEKVLFNKRKRSRYINQALHDKIFAMEGGGWMSWLLNLVSTIVPTGYEAVENYSSRFVQVGVVAHPLGGFFPTPFGGERQLPIAGSSFATAFMSAYVVRFLTTSFGATRADILDSLKTHRSLTAHVQQGRYLELDTVTGRSIEENFDSVLHAVCTSGS